MEQKYTILNAPVICAGCGKVYYRKSYEEPYGWLHIVVKGPRYEPFFEWYLCSSNCIDIVVEQAKRFCSLHLA